MKKLDTICNGSFEVTTEEFLLLSWIATVHKCSQLDKSEPEKVYWQLWGLETAAATMNIPWELVWDIKHQKRYTQYRNMNRIATVQFLS